MNIEIRSIIKKLHTIFIRSSITIQIVVRIALGIIFVVASWDKICHPQQFEQMIANYQILSALGSKIIAIILPWIEISCGIFLIIGFKTRGGVIIINSLLFVFIIALSSAYIRGLDINCGCFSVDPSSGKELMKTIERDILMLAGGVFVYIFEIIPKIKK